MLKSAQQFYDEVLKQAELAPVRDDIAKVAEQLNVDTEQAKLAKAFYDQMQLDRLPFSDKQLAENAQKCAASYIAHRQAEFTKAASAADAALTALLKAAGELKIAGLTPAEILIVAARQLDSANEYTGDAILKAAAADVAKTAEAWTSRKIDWVDPMLGGGAAELLAVEGI